MSALSELAQATRTVAAQAGPSVVRVGRAGGRGCGVVIGPNQILTNAHNLRGAQVTITFADGRVAVADVVGADGDGDLAVLQVDTADAPALDHAASAAEVGDVVFTVARGAGGNVRTTFGSVSATERPFRGPRGRRIEGSLEHTAPLARGSSGSPVLDAEGKLVGLNTNRAGEGFYLALPAGDDLQRRITALASGRAPAQRHLGIAITPAHVAHKLRRSVGLPERDGLLVRGVEDGSPARTGGLQRGDLIVKAGDADIRTVDDLYQALDDAGDTITLGIVRGADELELHVSFVAGGADPADPTDAADE